MKPFAKGPAGGGLLACASAALLACAGVVLAAPTVSTWHGGGASSAVAAAPVAGWYATSDTTTDTIELCDIRGDVRHTITREQIAALAPWMTLDASADGPGAVAFSDSGRLLFIGVHDAAPATDALPSDAVLRFDTFTGALTLFARLELSASDATPPRRPMAFARGRLYVGTQTGVVVYRANRNDAAGTLLSTGGLPNAAAAVAITVDRDNALVLAIGGGNVYRASATVNTPSWTLVGSIAGARGATLSDQFGAAGQEGLYVLADGLAAGTTRAWFVPLAQVRGTQAFAPTLYATLDGEWRGVSATADGGLLAATDAGARRLSDTADGRLGFEAWLLDEFRQVVTFARELESPDGEPAGWVLDADVQQGWSRFHPATPDGACWAILALLASEHVDGDTTAQSAVRRIMVRYAGLASDGIAPSTSADGMIRHWIDPQTGGVKPGWPTEFATYSQMKIVLAAERAMAFYPDDPVIQQAGARIVCQLGDWDSYIRPDNDEVYLIAQEGGGPQPSPRNGAFSEGILFVEQASVYGGPSSDARWARWINRVLWPTATFITGLPVTTASSGVHHPAFLSLYSLLVQREYRDSVAWRTHVRNLLASNAAWTDDNMPRYFTVFSAGTTKGEWGGYRADTLTDNPGRVTTFPSLMAFAGTGETSPAVSAYHGYRRGARQTFALGNSILYRRSDVDRAYQPDSAGLPDVVLGALGLAELIAPGFVDAVLARPYDPGACPPDLTGDLAGTIDDLYLWHASPADVDRDGVTNNADRVYLQEYVRRGEPDAE